MVVLATHTPCTLVMPGPQAKATWVMTLSRNRCDEAGLSQCAAHGLRKAAAVRHALNGATAPELMAWFGWKTLAEAQRYCEMANRIKLAQAAGLKMNANKQ
jgi:hypothetical protein